MKRIFISGVFVIISIMTLLGQTNSKTILDLPMIRINNKNIFYIDSLGQKIHLSNNIKDNTIRIEKVSEEIYHLTLTIQSKELIRMKELEISMQFMPDSIGIWENVKESFHWVPNLKEHENRIISQHVFRSPAIILTHEKSALSFIPDLKLLSKFQPAPYYMDIKYKHDGIDLIYGISDYNVSGHVYYEKKNSLFSLPEKLEMGMYFICSENSSPLDILEKTNSFLWDGIGEAYQNSILPQTLSFKDYATRGYEMALKEYWVDGDKPNTGGITLSTFFDESTEKFRGRESKDDIWFHSWFNNIRTAYGLYQWGEMLGRNEWKDKAKAIINLFMTTPQKEGFFPIVWTPENERWISSGQGGGKGLYHVPDNVWSAYWLMRFNKDMEAIPECDIFLANFAQGLLKIQNPNGSFPARVNVSDLSADPILSSSASSAIATWFLAEMLLDKKLTGPKKELVDRAVLESLKYLEQEVLPIQRFEDFEVYFSCSQKPMSYYDAPTCMYPQNTLSIQWCSEAFLKAYELYKDSKYLANAEFCLNILSMYQQVWNPPYLSLYAFGGFGAQNSDAEWNDARQAQFAETYLNFYFATNKTEYLQRAIYACRSSFTLMAIPENKFVAPLNYKGSTQNGEYIGAMAENFGHDGINTRSYQSGFHWGVGSALTTAAIFKAKLGDIYIDPNFKTAIGVDGVVIENIEWGNILNINTSRLNNSKILEINLITEGETPQKIYLDGKNTGFILK